MSEPSHSVPTRAARAFTWSFGNTIAARLGTLAIGVALARVLGPEEFGIFAIATVALLAVLSFNELGVSLAIIRWRDHPSAIAPTVNTIAVASSALLTVVMYASAPLISTALGDVAATPVVQVLALSILINGLVATPAAILQREFMQKERTIADQVNTWLGAGLSLVLALLGWGAMSLAIGRLVASLVFSAMIWRWSPVPYRFGWDREVAGRLWRFGLPLAASSIIVFASGFADQIIVGAVLGAQALGFYVLAFNLASWPVSIFSQPLRAVAPAMFSAIKDEPDRMSRTYVRVFALLMSVAVPACLAVSGAAQPVIEFVYGTAWLPAAQVLLWLAAFAAFRIGFELAYDYLVVLGRSGWILVTQAVALAAGLPLMLALVVPFGAPGVAAAQVIVAAAVLTPLYALLLNRNGVRAAALARAVMLPAVAGGVVWCAGWALSQAAMPDLLTAAIAGGIAVAVIGALLTLHRDDVRRFRDAAGGRHA
ncbi:lipopolysaccharide biosynthesis protein [Microbacterium sp. W1N]|uniref:lipopolysaccharide biosynthesis protein n=1 Tax=Microbacterium festucae TaxID=2977531 RepID=UPI0021C14F3A|nr:lipopolysaccharide biosynthesis protein [Microbacterium festucae]MCT9818999.1 lipopolysaccharide biosynthesis protein [Microbacterium festucae]